MKHKYRIIFYPQRNLKNIAKYSKLIFLITMLTESQYYPLLDFLKIMIRYTITNCAQKTISNPFVNKMRLNPFTEESRNFRIDFEVFESEIVNLSFPTNYKIENLPLRINEQMKGLTLTSLIFPGKNSLEFRKNIRHRSLSFTHESNKQIKRLYDAIVESDAAQIVLQKK